MEERYELMTGKFGMYFYDHETGWEMPLEDVLKVLNDEDPTTLKGQ